MHSYSYTTQREPKARENFLGGSRKPKGFEQYDFHLFFALGLQADLIILQGVREQRGCSSFLTRVLDECRRNESLRLMRIETPGKAPNTRKGWRRNESLRLMRIETIPRQRANLKATHTTQ